MLNKKKKSFFEKFQERIEDVILMRPEIDEEMMEELEEALIMSDIGMETAEKIMDGLRLNIKKKNIRDGGGVKSEISDLVRGLVDKGEAHQLPRTYPLILLIIGVNGSGKTTSIAKIAKYFKEQEQSVLLAAADTFRAAAGEQLEIWGQRLGVPVVRHTEGSDPSAVIFDAISAAKARGIDVVICDTACRLQTKKNLMTELEKMHRIIQREYPEATRETLLVLDGTTGKNAISQTREFHQACPINGLVLTKLDGTAKGGIVITIADQFDLPVKFIGTGEGLDDLELFDPADFAATLFRTQG